MKPSPEVGASGLLVARQIPDPIALDLTESAQRRYTLCLVHLQLKFDPPWLQRSVSLQPGR